MTIPPSYCDPCDRFAYRYEMPLLRAASETRPDYDWYRHVRDLEWLLSLSDQRAMLGRSALVDEGAIIEFEVTQ